MYKSTVSKFQKNRYDSLKESMKEIIMKILEDEMMNNLIKFEDDKETYWTMCMDRIEEIFNFNFKNQRELYIEKLINQYSFLKNEFVKTQAIILAQKSKIQDYIKKLKNIKKDHKKIISGLKKENADINSKINFNLKKNDTCINKIQKDFNVKIKDLIKKNTKINNKFIEKESEFEILQKKYGSLQKNKNKEKIEKVF